MTLICKPAGWKAENPADGALNLGAINASQEDKAGVVFRLVPLVQQGMNDYFRDDSLEVHALFVFHAATPQGSSAEPFNFDPDSGAMTFKGAPLPYLLAGLLGGTVALIAALGKVAVFKVEYAAQIAVQVSPLSA
jgi:5-methylcytosine-specific restriction protein B